jgi:hypothetical protein
MFEMMTVCAVLPLYNRNGPNRLYSETLPGETYCGLLTVAEVGSTIGDSHCTCFNRQLYGQLVFIFSQPGCRTS